MQTGNSEVMPYMNEVQDNNAIGHLEAGESQTGVATALNLHSAPYLSTFLIGIVSKALHVITHDLADPASSTALAIPGQQTKCERICDEGKDTALMC